MQEHGSQSESLVAKTVSDKGMDLLEKGFQLAFFIIPNRVIALEILSNAMSKLKVQRSRKKKRAYWRDKYLKRKITRIAHNEGDALQWLIYFEAEHYERQQEEAGQQTARGMLIRYVKHLVQMTTAMSSFYVNVGMHRLLYNYSTSEARTVYEWVAQHYPGDQEYRTVKAALMKRLQLRFNKLIKACTVQYGELRFQVLERQGLWAELVEKCLNMFTPWSTAETCEVLAGLETATESLPYPLSERGREKVDQDLIETTRCHVFIEPLCHSRLTRKLGLESPQNRLAIPQFFLEEKQGGDNSGTSAEETPKLTEDERNKIMNRLTIEAGRRQRVSVRFLRIMADGKECLRLDVTKGTTGYFEVQDGAKLIEVWTEDQGEAVLFATHWIEYTPWHGIARKTAIIDLGDRRELSFEVIPVGKRTDELSRAAIVAKCQPVAWLTARLASLNSESLWFNGLPKYVFVAVLLVAIGWVLGTTKDGHEIQRQRATLERLEKNLTQEKAARASLERTLEAEEGNSTAPYLLVPDDLRIRGAQSTDEPVVVFSSHASQMILDLPLDGSQSGSYRAMLKPLLEDQEILSETFAAQGHASGQDRLRFILPAVFVDDRKHYLITLNWISPSGRMREVRKFSFYVKKQQ